MGQCKSQQTIVKVLKSIEGYYFKPINDYDNTLFWCMTKCPLTDKAYDFFYSLVKWMGVKRRPTKYFDRPLTLNACRGDESIYEPFVFTREEIEEIVSDVPEKYVGGNDL